MEIIRISPYVPAKSRRRNQRVSLTKGFTYADTVKEPITSAKLILETENIDLEEMSAQLEEAGENLGHDPSLDNFRCFKDSIGKFARTATSLAYCLDKIFNPRQRSHIITRVIDDEADYLYCTTMNSQYGNIRIASEIDDIKGMILSNSI